MTDRLPVLLSPNGEAVEQFSAGDFLRARGIEDIEHAETLDLARVTDEIQHLQGLINEAKGMLSDELIGRLDKRGKWTLEVGGLKVTAPSPDAGTVSYDAYALGTALDALRAAGVIDMEAECAAIEWVEPDPYFKVKAAGVRALLKLPAAREAIEACKVEKEPPARKATVKRA